MTNQNTNLLETFSPGYKHTLTHSNKHTHSLTHSKKYSHTQSPRLLYLSGHVLLKEGSQVHDSPDVGGAIPAAVANQKPRRCRPAAGQ